MIKCDITSKRLFNNLGLCVCIFLTVDSSAYDELRNKYFNFFLTKNTYYVIYIITYLNVYKHLRNCKL